VGLYGDFGENGAHLSAQLNPDEHESAKETKMPSNNESIKGWGCGDTTPCKVTPVIQHGVVSPDPTRACIPREDVPRFWREWSTSRRAAPRVLVVEGLKFRVCGVG
jgi:hypothetical protein